MLINDERSCDGMPHARDGCSADAEIMHTHAWTMKHLSISSRRARGAIITHRITHTHHLAHVLVPATMSSPPPVASSPPPPPASSSTASSTSALKVDVQHADTAAATSTSTSTTPKAITPSSLPASMIAEFKHKIQVFTTPETKVRGHGMAKLSSTKPCGIAASSMDGFTPCHACVRLLAIYTYARVVSHILCLLSMFLFRISLPLWTSSTPSCPHPSVQRRWQLRK